MNIKNLLLIGLGIVSFIAIVCGFGVEKTKASYCWKRANGQYTFGDRNSGFETSRDCEAAYIYYLAFPNGEKVCKINPIEEGADVECSVVGGNYDMTEKRPRTVSSCTTYTRNDWQIELHSKVDLIYSELLERATNPTDYSYWEFKIPYTGCNQVIDDAIIRNQVESSEERVNLVALKEGVGEKTEIADETSVDGTVSSENTGFWAFILSIPSTIWNLVLKMWR